MGNWSILSHVFNHLFMSVWTHASVAATSLQSCQTLCDPIDSSPQGSSAPGILQARTLEWVSISFSQYGPIDIHFILWGIIPKDNLLNLLHCSFCCSFGNWKLIPVFFDITLLLQGFFFFFKHFLFDTIRFPQTPLLYFLSEPYNQ